MIALTFIYALAYHNGIMHGIYCGNIAIKYNHIWIKINQFICNLCLHELLPLESLLIFGTSYYNLQTITQLAAIAGG